MLVDGSSFLFRAYHALPPLTNSKNQPIGAILGVINMLKKLVMAHNPDWLAVVFDSNQPNFRHKLFADYKINRTKMPVELSSQIPDLFAIIQALGILLLQIQGVEADDLIGSVIKRFKHLDLFNIIVTSDKDFAQLVSENIVLMNTMNNVILDPAGVLAKFKVPVEKIIDYLTLIGDHIDNIPGIPNVGPKTAVKWLEQYHDLAGIMQHSDQITGKVGDNLRSSLDQLSLYQQLITIDQDIDFGLELADFTIKPKDLAKLQQLFAELEIYSWQKELDLQEGLFRSVHCTGMQQTITITNNDPSIELRSATALTINNPVPPIDLVDPMKLNYDDLSPPQAIDDLNLLEQWSEKLLSADLFAIHLEVSSLIALNAEILGVYLATTTESCYVKLHNFIDLVKKFSLDLTIEHNILVKFVKCLFQALQDRHKIKVIYNIKFVAQIFQNYGITIDLNCFDVMLANYLLNSNIKIELDPKLLTAKQILMLYNNLRDKIQDSPKIQAILQTMEIPLAIVLNNMERIGVLIDPNKLLILGKTINTQLLELEKMAHHLAAKEFNLNSPKQLQEILYEDLGLPILEKTATGQPSTAEPVLQTLSEEFELPKIVLQYRSLSKLQSTYIDKLPKAINLTTGRIHTSYHQTATVTGRLSSSDPNLQNIPIRTVEGRKIRNAFIARKGYKILSADYSQIELRILAHLSEDPSLITAFAQDLDIHTITASEIFQVALQDVTADLRRRAKAVNFGLIYGMSDFGLAKQLKISRSEAATYIKAYFAKFPKVLEFMEQTKLLAASNGFVETMFGRRLYLPDLKSTNKNNRAAAERAAINAPMQGGQADLIKLAMIKLDQWIREQATGIFMLMQVHDELVFEIPITPQINDNRSTNLTIDLIKHSIKQIMQDVARLKVKLKVDLGIGDSWGEAH